MCNLYSVTKGPQAIREVARAMRDVTGNLPPLPGIFPDYGAPIVRNAPDGVRELSMARWGMPSPVFALKGRNSDPGVTNVRNVASPHWRRWLGVESRCVVPFTSFSENEVAAGRLAAAGLVRARREPAARVLRRHLDALDLGAEGQGGRDDERPLRLSDDRAQRVVAPIHPKAMPVILTTAEEIEQWMTAPAKDALTLQRPLPDQELRIVARGQKQDGLEPMQLDGLLPLN